MKDKQDRMPCLSFTCHDTNSLTFKVGEFVTSAQLLLYLPCLCEA